MANTKTATKRARQALRRQAQNQTVRSATRTSIRSALEAIKSKDLTQAKEGFAKAIKALSKAASKGAIPKGRAARKISRLTLFAKKTLPNLLTSAKAK